MRLIPLRFTLLISLSLGLGGVSVAQDLHYSLLDMMPTWVNAGLTGAYEGTARIGGLYRDQSLAGGPTRNYQTPGFYVDAPVVMLGKNGWLGIGATLINDRAGLARLTSTYGNASVAYHRIFNQQKSSRSVISFGLQGGVLQRSADLSSTDILLEEEQDLGIGGGGLGLGGGLDRMTMDPNASGFELGFGVSLARQIDAERNFRVGASTRHLVAPDYSLVQGTNPRPMSIALQAAYRQLLSSQYIIEPQAFIQTTGGGFVAAQLQGMVGTYLGSDKRRLLKAGLGVRLPARFVYPMVGYEIGDLKVAAAFDISANALQANAEGFQRGFELGVQYILKIYKQPKVERVILCPQI